MFERLDRFQKLKALKRSLKKRAPSKFPYEKENDYYVPSLSSKTSDDSILVDRIGGTTIFGREWNGNKYSENIELNTDELHNWDVRVSRFYGYIRSDYDTALQFWWSEISFASQRAWIQELVTQKYYNSTVKFRHDRIEVLKRLVELNLQDSLENNSLLHTPMPKSIVSLLSDFYGIRIFSHPAHKQISARFRMIVDSLVDSGELVKTNMHEYTLSGKALVTLSNHEQEERRHKDSVKQNKRLFWITVVIAVATALQAYSAYLSYSIQK